MNNPIIPRGTRVTFRPGVSPVGSGDIPFMHVQPEDAGIVRRCLPDGLVRVHVERLDTLNDGRGWWFHRDDVIPGPIDS